MILLRHTTIERGLDMSRTPTERNPKMGLRISQLRAERKMTQEELGAVIGVQRSAVRKYEKGEVVNLPASSIKKLSDCFEVDPCYLLGWTDEKECKGLNKTGGGAIWKILPVYPISLKVS
jgi:transcriptional regulator with XRE-family HTH domain